MSLANKIYPDQTAHVGAVWPGFTGLPVCDSGANISFFGKVFMLFNGRLYFGDNEVTCMYLTMLNVRKFILEVY